MIGLAACFAVLNSAQDRTAAKEVLPNGSTLYVQRIEGARTFSVVLASVAVGEPETPESHGARHLLEHLVAKGPKKDVDKLVESNGMVLLAETTRDAVTFQVSGPSASLPIGLAAIKKLLEGFDPAVDDAKRECDIITQELALRKWDVLAAADGWLKAYGERALDPFGNPSKMAAMTVEDLKAGFARLTSGRSLCICVAGPVDVEGTARQVRSLLEQLPPGPSQDFWNRPSAKGPVVAGTSDGVALCTPIGLLTEKQSLAAIGAALGIRSWIPGCSMLYTPTARNGMVTLALRSQDGWGRAAERLKGREPLVGQSGQLLLRTWLNETAVSPAKLTKLTAVILPLRPGFDPQTVGSLANEVTQRDVTDQVRADLAAANSGSAQ